MRKYFCVGLLGLFCGIQGVRAETGPEAFAQVDRWSNGGLYDDLVARGVILGAIQGQRFHNSFPGQGAGVGVRAGVVKEWDGFGVGMSLGRVWAPAMDYSLGGFQSVYHQHEVSYDRLLWEVRKTFPLSGALGIRLAGAAGVARGEERIRWRNDRPNVVDDSLLAKSNDHWAGATWEFMPSFILQGPRAGFEIGYGFAHFPNRAGDGIRHELRWNPVGWKIGYNYKF